MQQALHRGKLQKSNWSKMTTYWPINFTVGHVMFDLSAANTLHDTQAGL